MRGFLAVLQVLAGSRVWHCFWRLPEYGGPAEQVFLSVAAAAPGEFLQLSVDARQLRVASALARRDRQSGGTGAREMW